jgi:transposase
MSTQTIIAAHAIGIGIDVSKDKLDLAIRLSNQKYVESNFSNNAKGINTLCAFLKRQEAACAAPLIIESTGDYHLQSALMIKQRNYNVKVINPITTKRYQKSSVRNAKTDKIDAKRLSDIAVLEENLPDFNSNVEQVRNRKLVSLLAHLEKTRQQMTISMNRFEETAEIIRLKHSIKHFKKALSEMNEQIEQTKLALTEAMPEQVKKQADQTKGLSREKLAVIYTLVAGKHFDNCDQLTAFFGLDIAVRKSGKWSGQAKLSKRGNSYARKILYQIAWGLKTHNEIFKSCYAKYRKDRYHYTTILMILARKFLRYYFSYNLKGTTII